MYAHGSEPATPMEETARGFDTQYRAGRFEKACHSFHNHLPRKSNKWTARIVQLHDRAYGEIPGHLRGEGLREAELLSGKL
jgi:hypothetical protein